MPTVYHQSTTAANIYQAYSTSSASPVLLPELILVVLSLWISLLLHLL